jgi:PPOX class probable F420-dependent enzyme
MCPPFEEVDAMPKNLELARLRDEEAELFREPNFAHLSTLLPDGSPHVTPVWVDMDDEEGLILVNTARGRVKERNVNIDPRVGISVTRSENPYQEVSATGRVVATSEAGAEEHIDKLAKKYLGRGRYPYRQPGERRVIMKIRPERVSSSQV